MLYLETNKEMDYWNFNYLSLIYEIENLFHTLSYLPDDNLFILPNVSINIIIYNSYVV